MKTVFGMTKNDFMSRVFDNNTGAASGTNCLKMWEKYFDDHAADKVTAGAGVANASDVGSEKYNPTPWHIPAGVLFVKWMQCPSCGHYGIKVDVGVGAYFPLDEKIKEGNRVYCECGFHGEVEGNGVDSWVKPIEKESEPTKKEVILSEELAALRKENADLRSRINKAIYRFNANDPIAAACELTQI